MDGLLNTMWVVLGHSAVSEKSRHVVPGGGNANSRRLECGAVTLSTHPQKFRKGELELVEKATRALYSVSGTSRKLALPVDIQIELFNRMVVSVLTYGCEIWGDNIIRDLKHGLFVHRYTSTGIVCGELGMYPLEITINCKMTLWCNGSALGSQSRGPGFDPRVEWKNLGGFSDTPTPLFT